MFRSAVRAGARLRLALDGPAGSGKTYTALRFAAALRARYGGRIAVIDTEHGSARLYVGTVEDGHRWEWDAVELEHFAPSTYTAAMRAAAAAGYSVLVIDSLSHAWQGVGGALDQVDRKKGQPGGSFTAWKDVTPQHQEMISTILSYPGHVIATMRTKTEYSIERNEKTGKIVVEKIGLRPIQREGVEYEFTVVADIDQDHLMRIAKTRCSAIDGQVVSRPGAAWLAPLIDWLGDVAPAPATPSEPNFSVTVASGGTAPFAAAAELNGRAGPELAADIKRLHRASGQEPARLVAFLRAKSVATVADLPREIAEVILARLQTADLEAQSRAAF